VTNHKRNYDRQVNTWDGMKSIMRMIFMPRHYYKELYQMFQSLSQGVKSVCEYFNEMELTMIQTNVEEDKEATITRFMKDLNRDITHIMDLNHYVELDEMVHLVMKVGRQLKWKGTIRQSQPLGPLTLWKPNWKDNTKVGPS